ncbi:hypothetical protein ACFM35_00010 [Microbacterium sp. P01]|uniref:hypothetical protein n=1 Tax=Microbacterium sp. P01 TaxID=3366261 RepID=UPI0036720D6B
MPTLQSPHRSLSTGAILGPIAWVVAVIATFSGFVAACDLGLHLSAAALTATSTADFLRAGCIYAFLVLVSFIGGILAIRWRLSSGRSWLWATSTVVGTLGAVTGTFLACVAGILLASSSWGNLATNYSARNDLVIATTPYWGLHLLGLLIVTISGSVTLSMDDAHETSRLRVVLGWASAIAMPVLVTTVFASTALIQI